MESIDVIEMLAQHEESIGQLYSIYARRFPEHYDFWATMAQEEMNHAGMLRGLVSNIEEDSADFNPNRFRSKTVEASIEYIHDETVRAREQDMELINALSITLQIEQAMIEKKYFEVVEGISTNVKHLLLTLTAETEEHIRRVRELVAAHK